MPPSRFSQVSRYRNVTLSQSKPEERFSELGIGATPDVGTGRLLALTPVSSHIFARSSTSSNALIILPKSANRKYGKQAPTLSSVCSGQLGDFTVSRFQSNPEKVLLAAGNGQGEISMREAQLPQDEGGSSVPVTIPTQQSRGTTYKAPSGKAVSLLDFHPTCENLLLSASNQESVVRIWDTTASASILTCDGAYPSWDARWSPDGRQLAIGSKDAAVRLWDPRAPETCITIKAHASKVKPSRVTFVKSTQPLLLSTGFSQMRQREIAIWDHRSPDKALKRIILDVASSPLDPICDHDRGMVYLTAKGESNIRWIDVGSDDQGGAFAEGAFPLSFSASSAAFGPPYDCETGVGEIAKLYVASTSGAGGASASDSIIPVSVRVPRRTYIDFHSDLYPLTPARRTDALKASDWLDGKDGELPVLSLDPAQRKELIEGLHTGDISTAISPGQIQNTVTSSGLERATSGQEQEVSTLSSSSSSQQQQGKPAEMQGASVLHSSGNVNTFPKPSHEHRFEQSTSHVSVPRPATYPTVTTASATPPSTHWSRRFLAGTTPLMPSYQNLSSLDVSRAPAARMLTASTKFLFLPISGPGGRLGVHSLEAEGRLPLHIPSFQHGATLGDFVVNPFRQDEVITSAADGVIRVWKVPAPPAEDKVWPANLAEEPVSSISLPTTKGSNKVGEICPHPHVDGLVAVIPADADGQIHLVDTKRKAILKSITFPVQGLYSTQWSRDGSVLAAAGKDRKLYILDVRGSSTTAQTLGQAAAHDSPRPFNLVWLNDEYLLTVGHTTGSLRQLKLFRIDYSSDHILAEVAKHNLDVSPSILFPFWDGDVNVLWLWSKGERIVSSFEIQPEDDKEPFLALPTFQHNHPQLGLSFLRKDCVNVRDVEIDCSIRLCKEELQRVGWKITRSRPEFFQDDIFQPTNLIDEPLLQTEDWLSGKDAEPPSKRNLQPEGMLPLSQAPAIVRTSKLPKGPTQREQTDKEREEEILAKVFEKAKTKDEKIDSGSADNQAARAPDDDDWGSD